MQASLFPPNQAYAGLAVELDYLCRTRALPCVAYHRPAAAVARLRLTEHRFHLDLDTLSDTFDYQLCGCPVDVTAALRRLTRVFVQTALYTGDPAFAAVQVARDQAEIVLGGLWSAPAVLTVSAPVQAVADAVGRLQLLSDADPHYGEIGLTDTDWLAFMALWAGRLGVPVVATWADFTYEVW